MAIPYIDKNPKGNGYYTFNERKAEITLFLFGFAVLWSSLIVLGTFLRGPNWNFFGPYEYWDLNKLVSLVNVDLSELVWVKLFGMAGFDPFPNVIVLTPADLYNGSCSRKGSKFAPQPQPGSKLGAS